MISDRNPPPTALLTQMAPNKRRHLTRTSRGTSEPPGKEARLVGRTAPREQDEDPAQKCVLKSVCFVPEQKSLTPVFPLPSSSKISESHQKTQLRV